MTVLIVALVAILFGNSISAIDGGHEVQKRQTSGCAIKLEGDLPSNQPLMLKRNPATKDMYAFLLPNAQGVLNLAANEQMRVVCAGKSNLITKLGVATVNATCASGTSLTTSTGTTLTMLEYNCSAYVSYVAKKATENCEIVGVGGSLIAINIGFELADGLYTTIQTCFDESSRNAIYAKFIMTPSIAGQNVAEPKAGFVEGTFYPDVSVDSKYAKSAQKTTFGQILGSTTLGTTYIKDLDYYLTKGHLAARSDFVYGSQQRSTYWYVNAAPQWACVNGGNWKMLENNIRDFVSQNNKEVVIYVGTHGTATLPNTSGQEKPLYLAIDPTGVVPPKMKVPELFWKVVFEPSTKKAIAFVSLNNPHKATFTKLCTDVCSQVTWLTWQPTEQKSGFSYCCELNQLSAQIDAIPALNSTGLLF